MNLTEAELADVLDKLSGKLSHHMNRIELLRQERERKGRKIPTRDELELVNKVRNLQQHFHKLTNNKFNEGIEMNEDINDPKYQQKKEKKLASLSKQIDDHVGRLGLATERRKMKSGGAQHYQSNLEVRLHSKIDNLRQDHHRLKVGDIWPKKKSIWEDIEAPDDIEDLTEEELMELDKKTLASYIKKAKYDTYHIKDQLVTKTPGYKPDIFNPIEIDRKLKFKTDRELKKRIKKRMIGVARATDRLVKEDLEDLIDNIQSENYVEASNIFQQILSQKINDNIEEMKHGVNESVDLEDLSEESNDDWRKAWSQLSRPDITSDDIHKALDHESYNIREKAIQHKNATPEHIERALDDSSPHVRLAAISNPNASADNIHKALDKNKAVRIAAIRHPNVDRDNIHKALKDGHPIKKYAQERLNNKQYK